MGCIFKNFLGVPNEGLHKHVFGIAIFDVIGTVFIAWIIAKKFNCGFIKVLLVLFLLSVILHKIFCVETTVNKFLFG